MADRTTLGVISDTHIRRPEDLPVAVLSAFEGVERILHAGDIVRLAALERLERIAPVEAVRGNMDFDLERPLPERRIIEVAGLRIGLTHGSGAPQGISDRVLARFADAPVDVVVFGHSHHALAERRDGVLLLNPGSPTDKRWAPHRSVALLHIEDGQPRAEIVTLG